MKNTISGFFKHEIFRNNENEYTVGLVQVLKSDLDIKTLKRYSEGGKVTIVGFLPKLLRDEEYHFYGEFVENNQYGMQFKVDTVEIETKSDEKSLIEFLSSDLFKGVGKVLAKKIVEKLGMDAIDKILQDSTCLLDIKGMTENTANALFEGLLVNVESEKNIRFLLEHGFGIKLAKRIFKQYKQNTIGLLKENPYRLIDDIDLIGFKKADQLALSLGFDMKSPHRIRASIKHIFLEYCFSEGYTFIYEQQLIERSASFLNQQSIKLSYDEILTNVNQLIDQGQIIKEDNRLYLKTLHEAEASVANQIFHLSFVDDDDRADHKLNDVIEEVEQNLQIHYTPKQKEAIITALTNKIAIITGGPGTGKTTVVNGIIQSYCLLNNVKPIKADETIALVAPTGRAAKRMQETTGISAQTIHRFLGYGLSGEFTYNEHNTISHQLIICDETSMVDIQLMSYLLRALPKDTKIIFVGDVNQLPSVGPGEVLKDFIESGQMKTVILDKIHRQTHQSSIIELAHDINNQKMTNDLLEKQNDRNFIRSTNDTTLEHLQFIIESALKKGFSIEQIQILAPMYKGTVGIDKINEFLQKTINPKKEDKKEITHYNKLFRHGDKVIQLVNRPNDYVMNGDIGFITHVFIEPNDENVRLIVSYDDIEVSYTDTDLDNLALAYCISIHKSQGSEFDLVIVVLSKSYHVMLRKKLIYTAVTRAKKVLMLVGDPEAYQIAVNNTREMPRQTTLKERLKHLFLKQKIVIDQYEFEISKNDDVSPYDFM